LELNSDLFSGPFDPSDGAEATRVEEQRLAGGRKLEDEYDGLDEDALTDLATAPGYFSPTGQV